MKNISNRDEAAKTVKKINETANRISADIQSLSKELDRVNKFMREDSQEYTLQTNIYHIRNASTEFIRIDRKLLQVLPILRNLMAIKYPKAILEEKEEVEEEQGVEIVDKNVSAKSIIKHHIFELEEDFDGSKKT